MEVLGCVVKGGGCQFPLPTKLRQDSETANQCAATLKRRNMMEGLPGMEALWEKDSSGCRWKQELEARALPSRLGSSRWLTLQSLQDEAQGRGMIEMIVAVVIMAEESVYMLPKPAQLVCCTPFRRRGRRLS